MNRRYIFPLFYLITCIVYRNAFGSQFLDDTLSGIVSFEQKGWGGFKDSFGFTSLYYGHDILYFGFYSLFGLNKIAWFILFTGLHTLNAYLGMRFIYQLLEKNQVTHAFTIAMGGALLFLLSPYQTENVVWGGTMHYLFSMLFLWTGAFLLERFFERKKIIHLIVFLTVFAFSLVTLEIALVFPGLWFVLFVFGRNEMKPRQRILQLSQYLILPCLAIMMGYFFLNHAVHGNYIGHYGSKTHTMHILSFGSLQTMTQYVAKYFGYVHFFNYNTRAFVYEHIIHPVVISAMIVLCVGGLLLLRKKYPGRVNMITAFIFLIVISLIPVCSMYFMYLNQVNNDRLSYFSSFFMSMLLVCLFSLLGKRFMYMAVALLLIVNIVLLNNIVLRWKTASAIQAKAVETFDWAEADQVYILNEPCYYKGVYVFRNRERIERSLFLLGDKDLAGKITEVAWANQFSPDDDVLVEQVDGHTLRVTLKEWGRWFWYDNNGAADYASEALAVDFDDMNHSYTVDFKNGLSVNTAIIYFAPEGWKEFHFKPLSAGDE